MEFTEKVYITQRNKGPLEELIIPQVAKELQALYETRNFIAEFAGDN
jgi:hypothetical protein